MKLEFGSIEQLGFEPVGIKVMDARQGDDLPIAY
jgi:hypothetical protein